MRYARQAEEDVMGVGTTVSTLVMGTVGWAEGDVRLRKESQNCSMVGGAISVPIITIPLYSINCQLADVMLKFLLCILSIYYNFLTSHVQFFKHRGNFVTFKLSLLKMCGLLCLKLSPNFLDFRNVYTVFRLTSTGFHKSHHPPY